MTADQPASMAGQQPAVQSLRRLRQESVEVPVTVRVEMTPRLIAQAFSEMSDESQAQFFIDLAEIAATWGADPHPQWFLIGRHLRTCSCATEASRDIVAAIARGANGPAGNDGRSDG